MNPQTHRVVFNRSRGCMMAVSESAVEVRGQNVTSFGAQFNGTEQVHVEGVDKTLLYDVKEEQKTLVSCPSVRNTLCVEFQPLFFQRSASQCSFLMGLLHFFD